MVTLGNNLSNTRQIEFRSFMMKLVHLFDLWENMFTVSRLEVPFQVLFLKVDSFGFFHAFLN